MLFLALKKFEMVKLTPLQIPTTQEKKKKKNSKIFHPFHWRDFPRPLIRCIKSECHEMKKKKEKGHAKNKHNVTNIGKYNAIG